MTEYPEYKAGLMQNSTLRRYKRYFQIGGLLSVLIVLFASKSCISDMISYLAYHGGIKTRSRDPNSGGKDSADIGRRGDANSMNNGHMLPFYRPYPGGIASEYYESGLYIISGTVTSQKGSPLSGAAVFIPSRWWDWRMPLMSMAYSPEPVPLVKQICDVDGRYRIVLGAPFKGVLVVEKSGFAQQFEEIEMPSSGVLIKDYQLRPATACVEGSVSDQNGKPLSGADLYAMSPTGDKSILSPLVAKSDIMGRYRISSVPNGAGIVVAGAERHLRDMRDVTFGERGCTRCDFVLKDALDVRLEIKNPQGEAIAYASACGKGNSNDRGEVRLNLPMGTLPFDCAVSAPGYKEKHIMVDPENGVSTIILDKGGSAIEGRVITESGLPVENAKVSVGESGTVYTDKGGGYQIPLRHGGYTVITAYKAGYVESWQSFNIKGDGLTDNIIVMSSAAGGIYGRVVAPDGSPVSRFGIELTNAGGIYDREFGNPNGMFYINDVPAGRYSFVVRPINQTDRDKFLSFLISELLTYPPKTNENANNFGHGCGPKIVRFFSPASFHSGEIEPNRRLASQKADRKHWDHVRSSEFQVLKSRKTIPMVRCI